MSDDFVVCAICGAKLSSITWKHLSKHNMTVSDYVADFPNHPIASAASIARKSASAIRANAQRVGVGRSDEIKQRISSSRRNNPTEAWNKGIRKSEEEKQHLSDVMRVGYESGRIVHWNMGNSCPTHVRDKIRQTALSQSRVYTDISKKIRDETYSRKKANGWVHHSTDSLLSKMSPEAKELLNDPNWLREQHITNQRTIASMCVELGLHWKNSHKVVKERLIAANIPIQYWHQASSSQQRDLEDFITSIGIEIVVRDRTVIAPYELDIVIPTHNIAIEYCGLYWHSSEYKHSDYHVMKYKMCADRGIRLITIYSDEWLNKTDIVKTKLKHILGISPGNKVYARKCTIALVDKNTKKEFFDAHHIQGNGPSSVNMGLYHDGELVACIGFIVQTNEWVLNRFATSCNVVGGFSRLLQYAIRTYSPPCIVTFADLRWSKGDMYTQTGFELDCVIPHDYEYVDGEQRSHKFNFRHRHLATRLPSYDPLLSEIENTTKAGIHRIYDCGKMRFVYRKHLV